MLVLWIEKQNRKTKVKNQTETIRLTTPTTLGQQTTIQMQTTEAMPQDRGQGTTTTQIKEDVPQIKGKARIMVQNLPKYYKKPPPKGGFFI
jgi:hypothetical protein